MEEKLNYIYVRESTKMQAKDGYNLVEQERRCKAYIDLEGWQESVKVLCEYGKSSKTLNRPELKKLIKDIKLGKVKRLIIYKLDRLVRRLTGLHEILKLIDKYNVEFISVKEKIDTTNAMGRLMINLVVTFAEWEQDTISERTIEGLIGGANVGNYIKGGRVPYGYKRVKSRQLVVVKGVEKEVKKNTLQVVEKEIEIVRLMYQYAMRGYSALKITYIMNELDYIKQTNKIFSERVVRKILKNKIYCGIMEFRGHVYNIDIEKAVTFKEYQLVQKKLKMLAKVNKNDYLYKMKVYCTCGELCMHEVTNKYKKNNLIEYYLYYKCDKCNKRINEKKINYYVYPILFNEYKTNRKSKEFKKIKNKIDNLNEVKEILYDMYMKGDITKDTYVNGLIEYEKDLKEIKKKYDQCMRSFETYIDKLSFEEKVKMIIKNVDKIVVDLDLKIPIKISKEKKVKKGLKVVYK